MRRTATRVAGTLKLGALCGRDVRHEKLMGISRGAVSGHRPQRGALKLIRSEASRNRDCNAGDRHLRRPVWAASYRRPPATCPTIIGGRVGDGRGAGGDSQLSNCAAIGNRPANARRNGALLTLQSSNRRE